MDLNEQVARRRAEMAREDREAARSKAVTEQARQLQEKEQRERHLDTVAADLAADGVPVRRDGQELSLVPPPPPPPDLATTKRATLAAMVNREARRRWTPGDNWLVISCIAAGVALLHLAGLGAILIIIGFARRGVLNKRYSEQVLADYPQLKDRLAVR